MNYHSIKIMNTTVEIIKDYIKKEYGISFKLEYIGTHRLLKLKKGKEEYEFMCDYAYHELDGKREYIWSIYIDYMNYKEWHGNGRAIIDNGETTIDEVMKEWGFTKQQEQLTLF